MADNGLVHLRNRRNAMHHPHRPRPRRGAIDSSPDEELTQETIATIERMERISERAKAAAGDFDVPNLHKYEVSGPFKIFTVPTCHQGWKIHVPAPHDYELSDGYKDLFVELQVRDVPHKFVYQRDSMRNFFDEASNAQAGKFLTIYPSGNGQLKFLIDAIDIRLETDNFILSPRIRAERRVGSKNIATVRYGGFTSLYILDPAVIGEDKANRDIDNYIIDDRSVYKPDPVRDPFDENVPDAEGWVSIDDNDVEVVFTVREGWHSLKLFDKDGIIGTPKFVE